MTSKLTGFSPRSARRVAGVWTVFVLASAGWALGGQLGAVMAVVVGVALVFVQWWGQPAWSWAVLGCGVGVPSNGMTQLPWPTTDPGVASACKTVSRWWRCNFSAERTGRLRSPGR